MVIGIVKEIKPHEYRVGMIPSGVEALVEAKHRVLVERGAGVGSGFPDEDYVRAGGEIVDAAAEVFAASEMIVKVKEPLPAECEMLRKDQLCFTYFHFAADRGLTERVLKSGCVAIAYETVRDKEGKLPLLTPMSEVAGKMSVQEGAKYLERPMMGRGILLGGVPGVEPATVLVLGGGVVGTNAAKLAAGLGAHVVLMDVSLDRLRYLSDVMPANVQLVFSEPTMIRHYLAQADLVIGAVLIPGARCPVLVTREHLKLMKPGAVIVDVGVDQGGCCETIHPTTHDQPTYIVDHIVHYGVANMPGAVGRTSTYALTNATMPYALRLANMGFRDACEVDSGLAAGVNVYRGHLTNDDVARAFGLESRPFKL
ncbi:MAG: alanine dehydrogenase [Phycisphaerae bacterium]